MDTNFLQHMRPLWKNLIIAVLFLGILVLSGCGDSNPVVDTNSPAPTPTTAIIGTQVVIGGLLQSFEGLFGSPETQQNGDQWIDLQSSKIGSIDLDASTLPGSSRVNFIIATPHSGNSWDSGTAISFCQAFLPADTTPGDTHQWQSGTHSGLYQAFLSTELANTLPSSDFYNWETKALVPPGTASIIYRDANGGTDGSNGYDACVISVGQISPSILSH